MAEEDSFESFRYAMYNFGIRNQYKPDMNAVQVSLLCDYVEAGDFTQYLWMGHLKKCR